MAAQSFSDHRENAGYLGRAFLALRRSFFLSIGTLGVFLIWLGFSFEQLAVMGYPIEDGIIAGMLAICGATLLLIGGIGYGTLRYLRNY